MPKTGKGLHHYPTVENDHYLTGTTDVYYNYSGYNQQRDIWLQTGCETAMHKMEIYFNRLQYLIYKDPDKKPTEIILLDDNGLMLDWNTEIEKGLDRIVISHLWKDAPSLEGAYRFANGVSLEPIGRVFWLAPDLFYWNKKEIDKWNTSAA